jgi:hypothetical protein
MSSRKFVIACALVAILAFCVGRSSNDATPNRPILKWITRAVGVWLLFRDDQPKPQQIEHQHYVRDASAINHGNAL